MSSNWNWMTVFKGEVDAPFVLGDSVQRDDPDWCATLANLPFEAGVMVMVVSVPHFTHEQWLAFSCTLEAMLAKVDDATHMKLAWWLQVGQATISHSAHVERIVRHNRLPQAMEAAESLLRQASDIEGIGFMACLHSQRTTSVEARMLFEYLLLKQDRSTQQTDATLRFYQTITQRQQEVATLTAQGYTNREIAARLHIEPAVVAEHLTKIYAIFSAEMGLLPEVYGARYRMIHCLTRLFEQYPQWRRDHRLR